MDIQRGGTGGSQAERIGRHVNGPKWGRVSAKSRAETTRVTTNSRGGIIVDMTGGGNSQEDTEKTFRREPLESRMNICKSSRILIDLILNSMYRMYVHGDCTTLIRVFHESMHGNYPYACKIRAP